VTALLRPIPLPANGHFDLGVMALLSVALLLVSHSHGRRIVRVEAALLLTIYVSYILRRVAIS